MSKNILVIDDEPNLRHVLTVVLEKAGYTVSSAADGKEAISITETKPFDVILCDLRMPRMDGLAFLKQATTRVLDAAIIMMSAIVGPTGVSISSAEGRSDQLVPQGTDGFRIPPEMSTPLPAS